MALFQFAHSHKFGDDTSLVRVPDNIDLVKVFYNADDDCQMTIADAFGIDFEPSNEETLDVTFVDPDNIREYSADDLPACLTEIIH